MFAGRKTRRGLVLEDQTGTLTDWSICSNTSMPRPELHPSGQILDAAREVVTNRGARGVTLAAIAQDSGAPVGSIYHRFGSVDELLARLWLRAVRRSQAALGPALAIEDPVERAVGTALALYDFCLAEREDALLLAELSRRNLREGNFSKNLQAELDHVNEPIERPLAELGCALFDGDDRTRLDLALTAVVDLPYGFARRHVEAGTLPTPARRAALEDSVRAIVTASREPSNASDR